MLPILFTKRNLNMIPRSSYVVISNLREQKNKQIGLTYEREVKWGKRCPETFKYRHLLQPQEAGNNSRMAEPNTVHIWVVLYLAPERGSGHDSGAIYYFHIRRNPYYFTQIQFSSCANIKRRSHWGLFFFTNPTPCRKFSSAYRIPRYPIAALTHTVH